MISIGSSVTSLIASSSFSTIETVNSFESDSAPKVAVATKTTVALPAPCSGRVTFNTPFSITAFAEASFKVHTTPSTTGNVASAVRDVSTEHAFNAEATF